MLGRTDCRGAFFGISRLRNFALGEFAMVRRTVLGGNVGLDRGEVDGCLDELVVVGVLLGRGEHLKESAARAVAIHGSSARTRFPLRRGFKKRWAEMILRRRSKMESMG